MEQDELQVNYKEGQDPETDHTADLSDDDIAAALGFHTTLSEPLLPQDEMDTAQDESAQPSQPEEEPQAESEVNSSGAEAMTKDESQDKEIQDIRAELEKLLQKENGTETEDTATAE